MKNEQCEMEAVALRHFEFFILHSSLFILPVFSILRVLRDSTRSFPFTCRRIGFSFHFGDDLIRVAWHEFLADAVDQESRVTLGAHIACREKR
jgi:hypothetical protein